MLYDARRQDICYDALILQSPTYTHAHLRIHRHTSFIRELVESTTVISSEY